MSRAAWTWNGMLYVILFRDQKGNWYPYRASRGGLDIRAYTSGLEAAQDLYAAKQAHGRGNVKIIKRQILSDWERRIGIIPKER